MIITTKAGDITLLETWMGASGGQRRTKGKFICVCGKIFEASLAHVKRYYINSCGCYRLEKLTKHGHSRSCKILKRTKLSITYGAWMRLKQACSNKNFSNYKYNGAKGIKVCDEWLEFANFLRDMGEKPVGHRFNRLDKDGDYEPDNCEWVPIKKKKGKRNG